MVSTTPSSGVGDFRRYEYRLFSESMPLLSDSSAARCMIMSRVVKIRRPSVFGCISG